MRKIRIAYLHQSAHDVESFLKSVRLSQIPDNIELVWDMENPQILFATDMVFGTPDYFTLFKQLYSKAEITVFYCSEALSVDFNLFDLGITFDNSLVGKRAVQILPPDIFYESFITNKENTVSTEDEARHILENTHGFCNFIYSNPKANPYRDELFFKISEYKRVDSMGKHLNNTGRGATGYGGHIKECVDLKLGYKFSIACENAFLPGYTTEKILTSLQAHTVPIYWGNPDVDLDVNPDCFVNCMKYNSIDEVINRIREIDQDDDIWCHMVSQPWRKEKQEIEREKRIKDYYEFFNRLFTEDYKLLTYRSNGTIAYTYRDFFFRFRIVRNYKELLKKKINKYLQ